MISTCGLWLCTEARHCSLAATNCPKMLKSSMSWWALTKISVGCSSAKCCLEGRSLVGWRLFWLILVFDRFLELLPASYHFHFLQARSNLTVIFFWFRWRSAWSLSRFDTADVQEAAYSKQRPFWLVDFVNTSPTSDSLPTLGLLSSVRASDPAAGLPELLPPLPGLRTELHRNLPNFVLLRIPVLRVSSIVENAIVLNF